MTLTHLRHPATASAQGGPLRVAVLGHGSIGRPVADALKSGNVDGAALAAVVDSHGTQDAAGESITFAQATELADLFVEAAGQNVLAEFGPRVVAAGVDLLVLSIGALADERLHEQLFGGPGRLYLSTGAIGGLDLIRAVADGGTLDKICIETYKQPRTLVQDWMDDQQRAELLEVTGRTEVLRGTPQRIATAFPKSANVAMAVAMAAGDPAKVEAVVFADPECSLTSNEITVQSRTGSYLFQIRNLPSRDNPASSGVVPFAVLRAIQDLAGRRETLI
ncbi:aspartate dehydrogenase domain-containing protein [Nocardioides terrisoli]|uniref:aspartate dehydrogenase domain-containing protein n=1 Tax=Nocardioides terrisoli TaxID=3388267 RepID=UPI00287B9066|nr:aspartate dehydrogenase domain-containing protein [Nocardioides marmorisolisilvae]